MLAILLPNPLAGSGHLLPKISPLFHISTLFLFHASFFSLTPLLLRTSHHQNWRLCHAWIHSMKYKFTQSFPCLFSLSLSSISSQAFKPFDSLYLSPFHYL